MKTETKRKRCTCEEVSQYNSPRDKWNRHLPECACSPEITDDWLWYPHDGELEDGGVWIDPGDPTKIYLEVKEGAGYYLAPAFLGDSKARRS
jgi:hypothetical protein